MKEDGIDLTGSNNSASERILILIAAAFVLLPFISHTFIGMSRFLAAYVLLPVSLVAAGCGIIRNRLYSGIEMKLMLLLPVWFVLGCFVNFGQGVTKTGYNFFAAIISVSVFCFSLAFLITEQNRMKVFRLLAWIWAAPMTAASLFGLYLAVTGTRLVREGHDEPIGVTGERRLFLFGNSNTLGVMCCVAFALLLFLFLAEKKKGARITVAVMAFFVFVCMALSDCRSAKLAMLPCIVVFVFLLIRSGFSGEGHKKFLLCAILAGASVALLLFAWTGVKKGVNAVHQAAFAETGAQAQETNYLDSRDYKVTDDLYDTANVRLVLWKYAMEHFPARTVPMLFGYTPMAIKDEFIAPNPNIITVYDHLHNGYIGILVSYGIIGFAGFAVFLVLLLIASLRILLAKAGTMTDALRFLPVILIPILVVNCTEEMLFTRDTVQEANVWFALTAGFVFAAARALKNNKDTDKSGEE
ncbi:MAG: O-antigen ligase family protein [Clostridia bacterium]|nr:O-antigen ligase family protein [Clostridia bacterium]